MCLQILKSVDNEFNPFRRNPYSILVGITEWLPLLFCQVCVLVWYVAEVHLFLNEPNAFSNVHSRDNGVKAIENLMQKRGKFDYILLETTGLADPGMD